MCDCVGVSAAMLLPLIDTQTNLNVLLSRDILRTLCVCLHNVVPKRELISFKAEPRVFQ